MATQCDRCGIESEIEQAFSKERRWFGLQTRRYCPTCRQKRHLNQIKRTLLYFGLFGLAGLALSWLTPGSWVGRSLLDLFVFLLLCIPMVVVHELAHAAAGRLLNLRVFAVIIGYGQTIYSGRWFGFQWEVKTFPLGGLTLIGSPPSRNYRLRSFLTHLAGPAVHVLFLMLLFPISIVLLLLGAWASPLASLAGNLVWVNSTLLLVSLFPFRSLSVYGEAGSDGWNLLRVPFLTQAQLDEHFAAYYIQEGLSTYRQNDLQSAKAWIGKGMETYSQNPYLRNALGFIQVGCSEYAQSRETFLHLLDTPGELQPEFKYMIFNNIAYSDLMLGDPDLLAEADDYSARAYQNAPWQPPIQGTRGAVLVELGRLEEGIQLLKEAMAKQPDVKGKADDACHIARGEKRRGNLEEARRYLEAARLLDPQCRLIDLTARELGPLPGPTPAQLQA